MGMIIDRSEILMLRKFADASNKRVAFTNGCFDILHLGHVRTLEWARASGDVLVVGMNSDASVRRLKGPGRPVVRDLERAAVVAALACVDYVCLFDGDDPSDLVRALRPDVLVKGEDWRGKPVAGAEWAGRVEYAPLVPCLSTTLKVQDCARAWNKASPGPGVLHRLVAATLGRLLPGGRDW